MVGVGGSSPLRRTIHNQPRADFFYPQMLYLLKLAPARAIADTEPCRFFIPFPFFFAGPRYAQVLCLHFPRTNHCGFDRHLPPLHGRLSLPSARPSRLIDSE